MDAETRACLDERLLALEAGMQVSMPAAIEASAAETRRHFDVVAEAFADLRGEFAELRRDVRARRRR
jgi:hypothetical protein